MFKVSYPRPVASDAVVVNHGKIVLVKRKHKPFKGDWALPGGMVERESVEAALVREVREETGLDVEPMFVTGVYSNLSRDPRKTISITYLCRLKGGTLKSSDETKPRWFPISEALALPKAFDHDIVLREALGKLVHYFIDTMLMEGLKRDAPVLHLKRAGGAFRRLVFIMLSARTKDETTEKAVDALFSKYKSPDAIAKASLRDLEKILYGVGFYKVKAKHLKALSKFVAQKGIPNSEYELKKLPGVGPKTARVFLAELGHSVVGADVHVHRISNRIGLVKTKNPRETEKALSFLTPWERRHVNLAMVAYGQTLCKPIKPLCHECPIRDFCASFKG